MASFVGMIVLGARSVGHEFSYRTLGSALMQPLPRSRMLLREIRALSSVIGIARVDHGGDAVAEARLSDHVLGLWMAVAIGMFVSPWVTMVCRNALRAR